MIRLAIPLPLSSSDRLQLAALQQLVNNGANYHSQVILADQKWNSKSATLFSRVRSALESTCPGARRCGYCEDSLADEVEHIRPKSWFPDQTFDPNNYLFACGPCNGPKHNNYAVVDTSGVINEAQRLRNALATPPPAGQEALLHPRHDNPAEFFFLDLTDTFEFKPRRTLNAQQRERALYTIRILRINKDPLQQARKEAFQDFAGRLKSYYMAQQNNGSLSQLNHMRAELLRKQHITVWREMQRQISALPFLQSLFNLVPGAASW
ncbi:HNH endonuclease [Hymenobacter radiodurans]|uniref:HNH endonuclease n=1 Tax=Hymenobacter radiodurans TaxID=2496028 RepID=UPI0010586517|nr:HNH endonuclease [Hymenobacter radiodurans]